MMLTRIFALKCVSVSLLDQRNNGKQFDYLRDQCFLTHMLLIIGTFYYRQSSVGLINDASFVHIFPFYHCIPTFAPPRSSVILIVLLFWLNTSTVLHASRTFKTSYLLNVLLRCLLFVSNAPLTHPIMSTVHELSCADMSFRHVNPRLQ